MFTASSGSRAVSILLLAAACALSAACSGRMLSRGDAGAGAGDAADEEDGDGGSGGDGDAGSAGGGDGDAGSAGGGDGDGGSAGGGNPGGGNPGGGSPAGGMRLDGGPFSCMPTSCEVQGATCGRIDDGCGDVLNCGACSAGRVCDPATHQCTDVATLCDMAECGATTDACNGVVGCGSCAAGQVCRAGHCEACLPRVCGAGQCGTVSDGCGAMLDCGGCDDGEACDALTHTCKECERTSCLGEGIECGTISDGCGGTLDCNAGGGGCSARESCVQGACLPTPPPAECVAQGRNCGAITHACSGARVDCGTCPSGEQCVNNECVSCVPTSCAEKGVSCGEISDGCGGRLRCGDCETNETCHQGACCQPTSCAAAGKNCGTLDRGCGLSESCGTCDALNNQVCGAGGVANVCGICTPTPGLSCQNPRPGQAGEAAWECGDLWDGCKNVRCGTCESGEYCDQHLCVDCPSMAEVCGPGVCGTISTPCGNVTCPNCPDGEGCGAGGTANVCGPCPTDLCVGKNCGTRRHTGCAEVSCGPSGCGAGQTCGGGGVANVCGSCTPRADACGTRICGGVWNGCEMQQCGAGCAAGARCVNDGAQCRTPTTCSAHVGRCGPIDDGAGGQITCQCPDGIPCVGGTCCEYSCADAAAQYGGDPVRGCVSGPQTDFPDTCGGIIQCPVCDLPPPI
jgi:hypothetical protein